MKRATFLLFTIIAILLTALMPISWAQVIQPGTQVKVRLLGSLNTAEAKEGQNFSGTLAEPVVLGSKVVLARGMRVSGIVTDVIGSGGLHRSPSISLALTGIEKTPVRTAVVHVDEKSRLENEGVPSGGVVARASAGSVTAYAATKHEIVLPSGTDITFIVADVPLPATRAPEPVVERSGAAAPESSPAILRNESRHDGDDAYDALIFSDRDKWLIRSYFQSNYGNLPPGLARRGGDLPPGLEKHIKVDGTLPPALQKQVKPLPAELQRKLPGLPFGYSRVFLSGRVLIQTDDGQIVDVMSIYH